VCQFLPALLAHPVGKLLPGGKLADAFHRCSGCTAQGLFVHCNPILILSPVMPVLLQLFYGEQPQARQTRQRRTGAALSWFSVYNGVGADAQVVSAHSSGGISKYGMQKTDKHESLQLLVRALFTQGYLLRVHRLSSPEPGTPGLLLSARCRSRV